MKKLLLIIVLLHLPFAGILADDALYSGEVVVFSQGDADRLEVVPDALIQVLQKISGRREVPLSETLDDALANAGNLVLSFGYRNAERMTPDGAVTPELRLVAQFVQSEVDDIVRRAGLPRWRQERPPVQLWVVVDDGIKREMKPLEYDYAWRSMEEVATMRGLPVSWPELDEEEAQLIDMRLVWGGFTDYLVERGAPADGVAIVAVRRDGPSWSLRWNLASSGQTWSWRNSDQELMFALAEGVHLMVDEIAAANSILASEQGAWTMDMTVGGLHNTDDYAACLGYLQGLSLVTSVDVLGVEPGQVQFHLQLNASSEHLVEAFERGAVLLPTDAQSEYDYEFLHYGHD